MVYFLNENSYENFNINKVHIEDENSFEDDFNLEKDLIEDES